MKKNSLITAISVAALGLSLGVVLFNSELLSKEITETKAESVTFSSIAWNNIDYSNIRPETEPNYIPQNGYLVLLSYSAKFNPAGTDNFAYTNPTYSSHIKINGVPLNTVENSISRIVSGNLFIYFPKEAYVVSGDYYRPTIEIDADTTMYNLTLPYIRLEYCDTIGKHNKWNDVTNSARSNVTFSAITWNNMDYNHYGGKNGVLLSYSANLSSYGDSSGALDNINLKNTDIGSKIKINGEYVQNTTGGEIIYYHETYLWIYSPNMTNWATSRFAKIEIEEGACLLDVNLPSQNLYFVNNSWNITIQEATYKQIEWNNIDYWGKTPNLTNGIPNDGYMIAFSYNENIGPGSTQSSTTDVNMASNEYDIGSHLLVNGTPIKNVSGAMVGSYILAPWVFVYFPTTGLSYTEKYYRPTIELEECLFGSYILPAVSFEFAGLKGRSGCWRTIDNVKPVDEFDYIGWNNINYDSDIFGNKKGLMLLYTDNFTSSSEANVDAADKTIRNLAQTNLGKNIKINGVSLSRIEDGEVFYYASNFLWIYAPNMTAASNGYSVPHLAITTPTVFFDITIPSLHLNFVNNAWVVDESEHKQYASFVGFYSGYNNKATSSITETILVYDKILYNQEINLKTTGSDFIYKATLNGMPLNNIAGYSASYMGNSYIYLNIPASAESPTSEYPVTKLHIPSGIAIGNYFLEESDFYLNSNTNEWVVAANETIIRTNRDASFVKTGTSNNITGLRFESFINKTMFDDVLRNTNISDISFGTYIVPKTNYLNSSYDNVISYIEENNPSSSTYAVIENTNKDFTNVNTAESDGYYRFTASMYNIKPAHYAEGYIGVGYLTINNKTYYGNVSEEATTFYDLMVDAYNHSQIDSSYFDSILSFTTTSNSYELVNNSVNNTGFIVTYANKGYYQLTTNKIIRTVVIDGVPYKVNVGSGSTSYFAYYNGCVDFRSSLKMNKAVGEPVYELFPDTNSNTNLNTIENVTTLNGLFGSNAGRVWLDINTALGKNTWFNNCDSTTGRFEFDEDKVTLIHEYMKEYAKNGLDHLSLQINGWANPFDAPMFLKDGVWYNFTEATAVGDTEYHFIVPCQNNEAYQKWLDVNEDLACRIALEFDEFEYIEIINEIDGGPQKYYPDYYTNGTLPSTATVAKWSMDLCRAYSKGVKRAGSHIKVMTPALSCVDAHDNIHYYNSKNFLLNCYTYIESTDDTYVNDWFQLVNLHPYVFPSKQNTGADSIYLWNEKPSKYGTHAIDNTDFDEDWLTYMTYFHESIMGAHHDAKKAVAITEVGSSDMGGTTDQYWKYMNYNNLTSTVTSKIMAKINTLTYLEVLFWFRLIDFPKYGDGAFECFEPNFGMIEEDKTLKDIGKTLYREWNNGSTDYSRIIAYLNTMEGRA